MTTPLDDAWAERLALWLTDRFGVAEPVVENLRRPTSGYSSETVFFDATWLDDGGGHSWYGVIRMAPPEQGTFQMFDLAAQCRELIMTWEELKAFGDERLYVERYIRAARHVEVQVAADEHGRLMLHALERLRIEKLLELDPAFVPREP